MASIFPPYSIIETGICGSVVYLTLMCNRVRFVLRVSLHNLQSSQSSKANKATRKCPSQEFLEFLDNLDDFRVMEEFEGWAIEPCIPLLKRLAPGIPFELPFTLQEYFDPPTFTYDIVNVHGRLEAKEAVDESLKNSLIPRIQALKLPPGSERGGSLQYLSADRLQIIYERGSMEEEDCRVPKIVKTDEGAQRFFFKAAFEGDSFSREVKSLLCINDMNTKVSGVSKLKGLVKWKNSSSLIGLLLEPISHRCNLREAIGDGASHLRRRKWMQQLDTTVATLHKAGIIWGDVKPENCLIDEADNAIVVDFGGGYSPDFIDHELQDTIEGDLQGMSKIREYLGSP